jgi:hypothetical protein
MRFIVFDEFDDSAFLARGCTADYNCLAELQNVKKQLLHFLRRKNVLDCFSFNEQAKIIL